VGDGYLRQVLEVVLQTIDLDIPPIDDVNDTEYVVYTEGGRIVESGASEVFIYDAAGKTIFNGKTESEMQRFSVPTAGIYFVRVDNKKNYRIVVK